MRKVFGIIGFIFILALLTPFLINWYIIKKLPSYYGTMSRFALIKIVRVQRYWFSTDVFSQVFLNSNPNVGYELRQHFQFGPLIFQHGLHWALARVDSHVVMAPFNLASQAELQFNRVLVEQGQITQLNYYRDLNGIISSPSIQFNFTYDFSQDFLRGKLSAARVDLLGTDFPSGNMTNLSSDFNFHIINGVWYGDESLSAENMSLKYQNQQITINNLTVKQVLTQENKKARFNLQLNVVSLLGDGLSYQPLNFNLTVSNLDIPSLENFAKNLIALDSRAVNADVLSALNQELYLDLVRQGLTAQVTNAELGTPHGALVMNLNFTTPAKNYPDISTALSESDNKVALQIAKPLAQYLLEKYFANTEFVKKLAQANTPTAPSADLILQQFVNLKFLNLTADGQSYTLEISLKNGRLYVNGWALQDGLNLLAPGASSKLSPEKSKLAITTQEMVEHYDS